jgi:pimeloyl-ACP methyl ester carboxylesterase
MPDGVRMVALSQGATAMEWHGPARGPVAVAIHGLMAPGASMAGIAAGLVEAGYRVLTYDVYGRGQSDRGPARQDRAVLVRQLSELLTATGVTDQVTLVGYSMGGAIATAFAAENPDRVKRLVLIAPAGLTRVVHPAVDLAVKVPVLGDLAFRLLGPLALRRAWPGDDQLSVLKRAEIGKPGFLSATLSALRGILAERQEADHRALGRADVPVIALWGQDDRVVPVAGMGVLAVWNRAAIQEDLYGLDHDALISTGAPRVIAVLRPLLRQF